MICNIFLILQNVYVNRVHAYDIDRSLNAPVAFSLNQGKQSSVINFFPVLKVKSLRFATLDKEIPGDPKKLHELDRKYFLKSKCYEDKRGISM